MLGKQFLMNSYKMHVQRGPGWRKVGMQESCLFFCFRTHLSNFSKARKSGKRLEKKLIFLMPNGFICLLNAMTILSSIFILFLLSILLIWTNFQFLIKKKSYSLTSWVSYTYD